MILIYSHIYLLNLAYISIIIIIKYVRRALVLQANNLKASESD